MMTYWLQQIESVIPHWSKPQPVVAVAACASFLRRMS
jgi:hypothetical protein